ncbi:MAG: bifunctional methylenetetrahydrofolate dehydrogenase/methenyltetrahydrofolate cyclohydrolase FolD [Bacteroidia bacterium]|nr:MAG: bifunctional methylenetetrahydrofolate dehydrogenase/methenyltetrahydrofolate cyclohydrolase FolD [Bacteroidia bacterium]
MHKNNQSSIFDQYQSKILNGKEIANSIYTQIHHEIALFINNGLRPPALAVILVGENPASQIYVTNKKNACHRIGIKSLEYYLASNTSETTLLQLIERLNNDPNIDGILVQLPLPPQLNSKIVIDNIAPSKDVDGFHRYNMGSLSLNSPIICPCTPHGIIYMLNSINYQYSGSNAVVIGASNIVGRPMALELLNNNATVTICNSKTKNLIAHTKQADLIIIAIGQPKFLKAHLVKPNSVIIDVGINRLADGTLCGDADFDNLIEMVQYITPVPNGVGPMTIAMLLQNTLTCYKKHHKLA